MRCVAYQDTCVQLRENIKVVYLKENIKVVYLDNYDMALGKIICAGVDLWLNTPLRPQEASGTSGMKAALNGVPSLSVLDGWWVEGHVENVTGWSIGEESQALEDSASDAVSLYDKLERVIMPLYYGKPESYIRVMRSAIALNGSFFNTQRMVSQYVTNAYSFSNNAQVNRVGGGLAAPVLPHHRAYGSVHGGS